MSSSHTTLAFSRAAHKLKDLMGEYEGIESSCETVEHITQDNDEESTQITSLASTPTKKQIPLTKSTNHHSSSPVSHQKLPTNSSPPQQKQKSSPPQNQIIKKSPPKTGIANQSHNSPYSSSPQQKKSSPQQKNSSPPKGAISTQKKENKTPSSTSNFSPRKITSKVRIEHEVWAWTNVLRSKPHLFIPLLEEKKQYINPDTNIYVIPGRTPIRTEEGASVIDETINFLKQQQPVRPLKYSVGLSLSARDHCKDKGPKGTRGHTGTNGSTVSDRVKKYGKFLRSCGENISYGCSDAQGIVLQLLVDDGVEERGHRMALFNPNFDTLGTGFGPHSKFRMMCVMDFADGYNDNEAILEKIPFVSDGIFDNKVMLFDKINGKIVGAATSPVGSPKAPNKESDIIEKIILSDTKDMIWFPVNEKDLEIIVGKAAKNHVFENLEAKISALCDENLENSCEIFKQAVQLNIMFLSPLLASDSSNTSPNKAILKEKERIEADSSFNFVFTFGNSGKESSKDFRKKLNLINNDAWFEVFETKMKITEDQSKTGEITQEITVYHAHLSSISKGFVGITFDKFFLLRFKV